MSTSTSTETVSPLHINAPPNVKIAISSTDELPGYLSPNCKDSTSGVVVVQEWWGMNESIRKTVDYVASQGFKAMIPDLYRGKVGKDRESAGHLAHGLDFAKAVIDINASINYLKSNGCKKVAVIGFCMGGALAVSSSTLKDIDAAVAFYGVPDLSKMDIPSIKIPIQGHFGLTDAAKGFSDPETAKNLEKTLKDAGKQIEVTMYEAGHAFCNKDSPAYDEKAATAAWKNTFEFLKKQLS